jgi:hypothetical protein
MVRISRLVRSNILLACPYAFRPLIESPSRFAVLRMASGLRPVFLTIAARSIVLAIAISSRSAFIDLPVFLTMPTAQPSIHYPVPTG